MQYKTTIQVVTDADNEREATDIAGEFLRGDTITGAALKKVETMSVVKSRKTKVIAAVTVTSAFAAAFLFGNIATYYKLVKSEKRLLVAYAIQPPLRTNPADSQGKEFKKNWEEARKSHIDSLTR